MADDHKKLFMIRSKRDELLDDDLDWWERTGRFVPFCRSCGSFAPVYPQPLNAVVQMRQRGVFSLSGRSGYPVLKRPFYDLLAPHMPGVVTGEVRFADGRLQKDSVTLNFPPEMAILLRGGHGSREQQAYRVCEACGRRTSAVAMLINPIYVLRHELPASREVFNQNCFLVLTESLSKTLDFSPFPDIKLQPVGVFDTPIEPVPEFGDTEAQQSE